MPKIAVRDKLLLSDEFDDFTLLWGAAFHAAPAWQGPLGAILVSPDSLSGAAVRIIFPDMQGLNASRDI